MIWLILYDLELGKRGVKLTPYEFRIHTVYECSQILAAHMCLRNWRILILHCNLATFEAVSCVDWEDFMSFIL